MGIETVLGLVFSKLGGILAAVVGVLFLFWRKQAATKRANKAEAKLEGVLVTQEAAQATAEIDKEVASDKAEIDQAVAGDDLEDLRDKYNQGVDPPPGGPNAPRPRGVRRRDASGKFIA